MATNSLLLACIGIVCVAFVEGQTTIGSQSQYAVQRTYAVDIMRPIAAVLGALVAQDSVDDDSNTYNSPIVPTSTLANEANGCPANWHLFNGFCYVLTSNARNWLRTRNECFSMGGYLANFEDQAEFNHLRDTVLQNRNAIPTYVGFNDHIEEGNFINDIVNDIPQYLPFVNGENDIFGPGPGDCGVVRGNFVTVLPCVQNFNGLCKRRQNSVLTYTGL